MIPAILKIKSFIYDADSYMSAEDWVCIEKSKPRVYLICDSELAREILKNKYLAPENLLLIWKLINRLKHSSLPNLTEYFHQIPLLHDDIDHKCRRMLLGDIYQGIEKSLDSWLPIFNYKYFNTYRNQGNIDIFQFSKNYIDLLNREILARDLSVDVNSVPEFNASSLFLFMPNLQHLVVYEKKLEILVAFLDKKLISTGRSITDMWSLLSIAVMGQEPLWASLTYGIKNKPDKQSCWSGEDLMWQTTPVSAITRVVKFSTQIRELSLEVNDLVVISPTICHIKDVATSRLSPRSLSFGHGSHICPGRRIVTKIIDHFFSDLQNYDLHFDIKATKLKRGLTLTPYNS